MAAKIENQPSLLNKNIFGRFLALLRQWAEPFGLFLGMRIGLGMLAFFAGVMFPAITSAGTAPFAVPVLNRWGDRLLGVWSRWDGEWFLAIAQNGYRPDNGTSAFFPLFPLLIKLVNFLLGGNNYLLAGVLVAGGANLACLVLLFELVRRDGGRTLAGRTILYLAAFPTAFFLAAIYTEGLFLAFSLGAFLVARHYRRWWLVGLLVAGASLTRSIGILLLLPLGWEWWRQHAGLFVRINLPFGKTGQTSLEVSARPAPLALLQNGLGLILPPLLALAGWLLFNAIQLGNTFNFVQVQSQAPWNRSGAMPWDTITRAINLFFARRGPDGFLPPIPREDPNLIDFPFFVFFALLFLAACWQSWRGRLPFSYLLYFGLCALFPLFSPAGKQPLLSFPRFGIILFPAFIVLAQAVERWRWLHYVYVYPALLLLGLFFSRFVNWYWIA